MKKVRDFWSGLKLNSKFTIITILFFAIPVIVFSLYLFQSMENNSIHEKKSSVEYNLGKNYEQIKKNVDSINMSTQFFLSDQALLSFLADVKQNRPQTTEELREFYNVNIASLERLVNNNPYLYQIRVYADSDTMQEMMPILYRKDRMMKLSWAQDSEKNGFKFNYEDTIFDSYVINQNQKIMSYVTAISDYDNGELGILEVAMSMETMFPSLYESEEGNFSCFIDEQGNRYFGIEAEEDKAEEIREMVDSILMEFPGHETDSEDITVYDISINDNAYVVGVLPVKELSGTLITVNGLQKEMENIKILRLQFIAIMAVIVCALVILIHFVVKGVLCRFYKILFSIREVQKGDLDVVIDDCGRDEMGELGTQINKMLERIKQLMNENIQRELLVKNSEIKALQNQINAHFIYNVLESIKMMAEIEEKYEISDAVTTLGKLLRYGMRWVSGNVTVKEEIEYIKNYLLLINLRFDYEIRLSIKMPDIIYEQEIPKMTLQPIVENAIYHGIEQLAEDSVIYVKGIVKENDCIIEITDAGRGMSEEELENLHKKIAGEIETSGGSGNGIGLKNVQDRIKLSFGENYGIDIASRLGCYTKIIVKIPLIKNRIREGENQS